MSNEICTEFCPCSIPCPLEKAFSIIGGKWKLRILCVIFSQNVARYNELKKKVKGITNTMLASSLKELEENGMVIRKQYNEMPVRVEYSLTEDAEKLIPIIVQLGMWANSHKV